jgi:hypothetical protein
MGTLEEFVPAIFTEDVEFVETPERVDSRTYPGACRGHRGVQTILRAVGRLLG